MAKVPTATDLGLGQVKSQGAGSTPFQSFNTNEDMFGARQGRAASQAGQQLSNAVDSMMAAEIKAREEEDLRNKLEVEAEIKEWESKAKKSVEQRRLSNAQGVTTEFTEARSKAIESIMKGRDFSAKAQARMDYYLRNKAVEFEDGVYSYERGQMDAHMKGLLERRVKDNIESAASNFMSPQKMAENMNAIKSSNKELGVRFGWSAEEVQKKTEDDISSAHVAAIDRMLSNNMGKAAKIYLDQNKDQIDGKDISNIEKAVESGAITEEAQGAVDTIMAKNLSQSEALKEARTSYDGKERDEIVKRLKVRYAEESSLETARNKQLKQSGWEKISNGGSPDDLTPMELSAAGREVESMWKMVENRAQRGKGFALTSNTEVVQEYLGMADDEIVDQDLTPLMSKMTERDWGRVMARQKDAIKSVEELKDNPGMEGDIGSLVNQYAPARWGVSAGGNFTANTSDAERVKINEVKDSLRNFRDGYIEKHKRRPSDDELRAEAARIMLSVTYDTILPFDRREGIVNDFADDPISNLDISDEDLALATGIPEDALDHVKGVIEAADVPLTINNMMKLWSSREDN